MCFTFQGGPPFLLSRHPLLTGSLSQGGDCLIQGHVPGSRPTPLPLCPPPRFHGLQEGSVQGAFGILECCQALLSKVSWFCLVVLVGMVPDGPPPLPSLLSLHGPHRATLQLTTMDVVRAGTRLQPAGIAGPGSLVSPLPCFVAANPNLGLLHLPNVCARPGRSTVASRGSGVGRAGWSAQLRHEAGEEEGVLLQRASSRDTHHEGHCSPFKQVL